MIQPKHLLKRLLARAAVRERRVVRESRQILAHPLVRGMPKVALASLPAADRGGGESTARRLIAAYQRSKACESSAPVSIPEDDLWTQLVGTEFRHLLRVLEAGDAAALSAFLLQFGEQYTWFGGLTLSVDGFTPEKDDSFVALTYLDKLVCLAESLGVLPVECPEQRGAWGENLYADIGELLDGIEDAIGIPVVPPSGAVPVTGLATDRGPLHYRHLNALYAALRVKELLPDGGAVCEYGGGLGLVAYYANRLGFRDYTLYDLPLVNVFSGHFLIQTLGNEAVCLYGEGSRAGATRVLPYWECAAALDGAFSFALNQDSFPEIDPRLVRHYIQQIRRTTVEYFLSINQEAQARMGMRRQNSVQTLLGGDEAFQRVYRMGYWLREGYVEELYRIRPAK